MKRRGVPTRSGVPGLLLCLVTCLAACGGPATAPTATTASTPATASGTTGGTGGTGTSGAATFTLTSPVGIDGGELPAEYTCDGAGVNPELAWANPPAGTQGFALLMTTLPGDGTTKWNWVLYNIPASASGLPRNSRSIGVAGVGSDGPTAGYQPPCSQGPGLKRYTFTLYALSGAPRLTGGTVTGSILTSAVGPVTIGTASLNLSYARPR